MSARVEVVEPGVAVAVQDRGRSGFRSIGVPLAGAADRWLLACANALLGQQVELAALEIGLLGPRAKAVGGPVQLALAGDFAAQVEGDDGALQRIDSWRSVTLQPGETLKVGACRTGIGYIGIAGGIDVPTVLGSRATYARASLGGVNGRVLQAGDVLTVPAPPAAPRQATPFTHVDGPIRALPGPQQDHFDAASLERFAHSTWRVSREADRMGLRLEGPALKHVETMGADIVSEAVAPGAVQVPGSGQPIVLGVDAQTIGGYAKIATVINADLPRLAHLRPGSELRFEFVTREQALAARQALHEAWQAWCQRIARLHAMVDPSAEQLLAANLISGMIDADPANGGLPWEHQRS